MEERELMNDDCNNRRLWKGRRQTRIGQKKKKKSRIVMFSYNPISSKVTRQSFKGNCVKLLKLRRTLNSAYVMNTRSLYLAFNVTVCYVIGDKLQTCSTGEGCCIPVALHLLRFIHNAL